MDVFNIVAGIASIVSLVITLLTLNKVTQIKKNIDNSVNSKQTLKNGNVENSNVMQAGGDINKNN